MLDQKENATTAATWQDNHSGRRGHKLMTKEIAGTIPPLYANDGADDPDVVVARVKQFSPYTGWRWYITEWDPQTGLRFGLVEGFETELGYFALTELAEVTVFGNVPAVERDLYWEPMTRGTTQSENRQGEEKPCLTKPERKQPARMPRALARVSSAIRRTARPLWLPMGRTLTRRPNRTRRAPMTLRSRPLETRAARRRT